jgi:hypothetical protein
MSDSEEPRQVLELRADEARRRLQDSLERLNERRHQVVDKARAVLRPPTPFILMAVVGLAGVLLVAQRVRARRRQSALGRLLQSAPPGDKGFLVRGLERAGTSLVALGAERLARQSLDRWVEAEVAKRRPSGFRLT